MPLDPKIQMPYYEIANTTIGTKNSNYTILLNQAATADPIATILNNTTIHTITWTRLDVGDYAGAVTPDLDTTKSWIITNTGLIPGHQVHIRIQDPGTISVTTAVNGSPTDGLLTNISAKLEIYQ